MEGAEQQGDVAQFRLYGGVEKEMREIYKQYCTAYFPNWAFFRHLLVKSEIFKFLLECFSVICNVIIGLNLIV